MCRQTKETCPLLYLYNITWFNISSIVLAARFVLHISTQDVETEPEKDNIKQKHFTEIIVEEPTHPSASQCEWIEVKAMLPAQIMLLMGFDIKCTGRISRDGSVLCVGCLQVALQILYAWHYCLVIELAATIHSHTRSILLLDDWPSVWQSHHSFSSPSVDVSTMPGSNNQTQTLLNGSGSLLAKDWFLLTLPHWVISWQFTSNFMNTCSIVWCPHEIPLVLYNI